MEITEVYKDNKVIRTIADELADLGFNEMNDLSTWYSEHTDENLETPICVVTHQGIPLIIGTYSRAGFISFVFIDGKQCLELFDAITEPD